MTTNTLQMCFILRAGSTAEEKLSDGEIKRMCREGELTASDQLFLENENRWCDLGQSGYSSLLAVSVQESPDQAVEEEELDDHLRDDYWSAVERLDADPTDLDIRLEVARLACDIDDREVSKSHFQQILDARPFHSRTRLEIRKRFSRTECEQFQNLSRPAPAWEDLSDLLSYPFALGPIYAAVPAAVILALSFVPFGGFAIAMLGFLWAYGMAVDVAAGSSKPTDIGRFKQNPLARYIVPGVATLIVAGEFYAIFYGIARLAMLVDGGDISTWAYISGSPVFVVTMTLMSVLYLPAAVLTIVHKSPLPFNALSPVAVGRSAFRMAGEYLGTVLLLLLMAFLVGGADFLLGGVPVVGKTLVAILLAVFLPTAGMLMGRLLARNAHLLG